MPSACAARSARHTERKMAAIGAATAAPASDLVSAPRWPPSSDVAVTGASASAAGGASAAALVGALTDVLGGALAREARSRTRR